MLHSKSIGHKIAAARKNMRLSQAELAQQVSISPQAVGKWERGESMPDINTLNKLAAIFDLDLNYFSDNTEPSEIATITKPQPVQQQEAILSAAPRKKFDWNWDMSQGNWVDADFSGLKNLKEKFSSSNMKNCKFINADLPGLILAKNNIELCDFTGSDLRDSKIQISNLSKNQFRNCSFIDAVFYKNNIGKCDFSEANLSGAEFLEVNFEQNEINAALWKFTMFKKSNLSNVQFSGALEDCHFEQCSFYNVRFDHAIIQNTFFKQNDKLKKVAFINCKVDTLTYAFLKNNGATMTGITVME